MRADERVCARVHVCLGPTRTSGHNTTALWLLDVNHPQNHDCVAVIVPTRRVPV